MRTIGHDCNWQSLRRLAISYLNQSILRPKIIYVASKGEGSVTAVNIITEFLLFTRRAFSSAPSHTWSMSLYLLSCMNMQEISNSDACMSPS